MNQIKIYDVAGKAGVSLATVSRVMNHPDKVKPATRKKIEKIIEELGYRPNLNAKGLASMHSTTIALVINRLNRSNMASIVNGVADCATKRKYLIRLFINNDIERDQLDAFRDVWKDVEASSVDGAICINDETTEEYLNIIKDAEFPVVLTATGLVDNFPCVTVDYELASYELTKDLIKKGYKKIWLLTTIHKYVMNDLKIKGYSKAMDEAKLTKRIIKESGEVDISEGNFKKLLKEEHPEVAIGVRDSMAISFMNAAFDSGLNVPKDLEVIGFQNTSYARVSRPKLTCVNTPIYELGEKSMELLTNLMEDGNNIVDKNIFIDYNIIKRGSTK